jgi:S-adenosyl-L-methionine hydrolase (adenosine-forming)
MSYDWVSFTTDYGRGDGFVAACRGVIARIAPRVRVIDVTHDVPAGDVRRGATALAQTIGYLPPAVHLAVVDPGVGTERRGLAVVTGSGVLVGPDNGLLLPAAEATGGVVAAYELTERSYWLPQPSRTFHGRDVFAPVVGHLSAGVEPPRLGRELAVDDLVRLPEPLVTVRPGELTAEVLAIDRFGNVQLAARAADLESAALRPSQPVAVTPASEVPAAGAGATAWQPITSAPDGPAAAGVDPGAASPTLCGTVGRTFADVAVGELVVFVDSAGHAAVAVNAGSAAAALRVTRGQLVAVGSGGKAAR